MSKYLTNPEYDAYCHDRYILVKGILIGAGGMALVCCSALVLWPWP